MASSKSIHKGQFPISCQLCEGEIKIQWKCCDCDLLMCTKCKDKIHPKFKNATDHRIIDIKEVGKSGDNSSDGPDFNDVKCQEHPKQFSCLFCKTCDCLVCPNCIAKLHNGHDFLDIKDGYNNKLDRLKDGGAKFDENLFELTKEEQRLGQILNAENSRYSMVREKILNQKRLLQLEANTNAEKLLSDLDQRWILVKEAIGVEQFQVGTRKKKLEKQKAVTRDIVKCKNLKVFFQEAEKCEENFSDKKMTVNLSFKSVPKFVPAGIPDNIVGILEEDSGDKHHGKPILFLVKKCKTSIKNIHYLSDLCDEVVWYSDNLLDKLHKAKIDGDKMVAISYVDTEVYGIAFLWNDNLLLSDGKSNLKLINGKTCKVEDSVFDVLPYIPVAVHVTSDRKVIVGTYTMGILKNNEPHSNVIVLNEVGNVLSMFEHDNNKKPLCTFPAHITSCRGNIFVVDEMNSDNFHGRVIILDQRGSVVNTYNGPMDVSTVFTPRGIVATKTETVIVAEMVIGAFHILNSEGLLISYISTKDLGINYPYSLSTSITGKFFVGCVSPEGSSGDFKADLFELEYSAVI